MVRKTNLERVVTMVPRCSILCGVEYICKAGSRGNWALRDSIYAILERGLPLPKAVPMNSGAIAWIMYVAGDFGPCQVVVDCDLDLIAPTSLQARTWEAIVEQLNVDVTKTIRVAGEVRQLQVIVSRYTSRAIDFVICVDVICLISLGILEPAAPINVGIACNPAVFFWVVRVLATERQRLKLVWRVEDWVALYFRCQ